MGMEMNSALKKKGLGFSPKPFFFLASLRGLISEPIGRPDALCRRAKSSVQP
jgi:hypothetical protein